MDMLLPRPKWPQTRVCVYYFVFVFYKYVSISRAAPAAHVFASIMYM